MSKIVFGKIRNKLAKIPVNFVGQGQKRISIRSLLTLLFLVVSIVPTMVVGLSFYRQSATTMKNRISSYSDQITELSAESIGVKMSDIEIYSIETAYSDRVQEYMTADFDRNGWEKSRILTSIRQNSGIKVARSSEDFVVAIIHPDQEQTIIYGNYGVPFMLTPETQNNLYQETFKKEGATFIMPVAESDHQHNRWYYQREPTGNTRAIMLSRTIKTLYKGEEVGVLMIRISEQYINQIYRNVDLGTGSHCFIINSKGDIFTSIDDYQKVASRADSALVEKVLYEQNDEEIITYNDGKTQFMLHSHQLPGFDLYFVGLIPLEYINSELNSTTMRIFFIMIVIIVIMILLSYFLAYLIANPLKKVIFGMHEARKGNLSIEVKLNALKEVEEVSNNFNEMIDQINQLVINVKDKEKQKRVAELKALQAQINPHFLSNTLDTARWMASIQGNSNVEDLISSLIQLINTTIGNKNDMIKIEEELNNIKCFLRIQEYRHYDKFKVQYDIEDKILGYYIPRLLLQPIVENAIVHGIAMMEGQGTIVIRGMIDNDIIRLQVTDNGVGIDEAKLDQIHKGNIISAFNGIGISNVRERIVLNFGENYGLKIKSIPELYTTCEIYMPKIEMSQEEAEKND